MAKTFTPLSPAEAQSPAWRITVKRQLLARLEEYRNELEKSNTDVGTASLRGKIGLLREILALETGPAEARRPQAALQPDE